MKKVKMNKNLIIMSTIVATIFVLIFIIDKSRAVEEKMEEKSVMIVDFFEVPKVPIDEYSLIKIIERTEEAIDEYYIDYIDYLREEIIIEMPEMDIAIIDYHVDQVMLIKNQYLEFLREFKYRVPEDHDEYNRGDYLLDVYLYNELLKERYLFMYNLYLLNANFINEYSSVITTVQEDEYGKIYYTKNPIGEIVDYTWFIDRYFFRYCLIECHWDFEEYGYTRGDEFIEYPVINELYDEIYTQVIKVEDNEVEQERRILMVFADALEDWTINNRMYYFAGYKKQMRLYLLNLQELGYVYDLDEKKEVHFSLSINHRPLTLGDIVDRRAFPEFRFYYDQALRGNLLDQEGTDFVSFKDAMEMFDKEPIEEIIDTLINPESRHYYPCESVGKKECIINKVDSAFSGLLLSPECDSDEPINYRYLKFLEETIDIYHLTGEVPILSSWLDPEYQRHEHSYYRKKMLTTLPNIALKEYSSVDKTRTIHFIFEDGTTAQESIVQTAHIGVVKELISGITRLTDEESILPEIDIPIIYHPDTDIAMITNLEIIPKMNMTVDSKDEEVTVVYYLSENPEEIINISENEAENNENELLQTPNTLSRIPLFIYIISAILVIGGIIILFVSRKKEDLEVI